MNQPPDGITEAEWMQIQQDLVAVEEQKIALEKSKIPERNKLLNETDSDENEEMENTE